MVTRQDHELPRATSEWGWRFHHMGIPTQVAKGGERYLPQFGLHVSGFPTSAYGVEWMRFDPDSPLAEIIKTVPHVAFEVDDMDRALEGKEVLTPPNSPSDGVRAAMIIENGCPIELIWFAKREPDETPKPG
jgi:hypothetical protein